MDPLLLIVGGAAAASFVFGAIIHHATADERAAEAERLRASAAALGLRIEGKHGRRYVLERAPFRAITEWHPRKDGAVWTTWVSLVPLGRRTSLHVFRTSSFLITLTRALVGPRVLTEDKDFDEEFMCSASAPDIARAVLVRPEVQSALRDVLREVPLDDRKALRAATELTLDHDGVLRLSGSIPRHAEPDVQHQALHYIELAHGLAHLLQPLATLPPREVTDDAGVGAGVGAASGAPVAGLRVE